MSPLPFSPMPVARTAPALPGTWKLGSGRAITLEPSEDGAMRVAHGRIWATFDGPHRGASNDLGDYVVGAGERLWVRSGQRLVIQAWDKQAPAYFSWDPQSVTQPVREPLSFAPVLQPLADLRLAFAIALRAGRRLVWGVARVIRDAVVPKPRNTCPHGA